MPRWAIPGLTNGIFFPLVVPKRLSICFASLPHGPVVQSGEVVDPRVTNTQSGSDTFGDDLGVAQMHAASTDANAGETCSQIPID